ncbi:hypothetical protein PSCICN_14130 [Pseudomonas cichorii]|uniref:hypothetical protein n=1 Tax=Pseudomonas cichorii TaxID=36746 RepID=UPI001910D828|nr:hypothetical protein [Pseudomonas cichorii]GFM80721.1 hypothetical protein PSCICN_14130 [Pseudomonas cichorii]
METLSAVTNPSSPSEIVVVDNDLRVLRRSTEIIIKLGWYPRTFSKPSHALEYIFEANKRVHTLLIELTTPGSRSGCEVAIIVADKFPSIRVIAMSEALDIYLQLSPEVDFIPKPWSLKSLSKILGVSRS